MFRHKMESTTNSDTTDKAGHPEAGGAPDGREEPPRRVRSYTLLFTCFAGSQDDATILTDLAIRLPKASDSDIATWRHRANTDSEFARVASLLADGLSRILSLQLGLAKSDAILLSVLDSIAQLTDDHPAHREFAVEVRADQH